MARQRLELSLSDAQAWLFGVVTHPDSAETGIQAQAELVAPRDVERFVRSNGIASALERLEIYQSSYFSRLEECLADDYPAVKFALGAADFEALCRHYADAHPSRSTSLNGFGSRFSAFARERSPAPGGLFVAELARLEWTIVEVLHAPAANGFSMAELARVPNERLPDVRFQTTPAVRMLSFDYPVNAFLQAFLDGEQPRIPARSASTVLVVRRGYRIRRLELEQCQSTLLRRLISGEPLGPALSGITATEEAVQAWFREWTELGVFTGASMDGARDRSRTEVAGDSPRELSEVS